MAITLREADHHDRSPAITGSGRRSQRSGRRERRWPAALNATAVNITSSHLTAADVAVLCIANVNTAAISVAVSIHPSNVTPGRTARPSQQRRRQRRCSALRPLRSHGQQWHQLPGHLRRRFRLLMARCHQLWPGAAAWLLGLAWLAGQQAPIWGQGLEGPEDFGRWQASPSHCQLQRSTTTATGGLRSNCRSVRLEQQLPGLLSLRLSEAGNESQLVSHQLTLAGVLKPGSRAMECRDGRCHPHWPLLLQVSAMAERGFSPQPGLSQLPRARLARGDCRLDAEGARCRVDDNDGLQWQVDVSW